VGLLFYVTVLGSNATVAYGSTIIERRGHDPLPFNTVELCVAGI
jgi:hypothetical protein